MRVVFYDAYQVLSDFKELLPTFLYRVERNEENSGISKSNFLSQSLHRLRRDLKDTRMQNNKEKVVQLRPENLLKLRKIVKVIFAEVPLSSYKFIAFSLFCTFVATSS